MSSKKKKPPAVRYTTRADRTRKSLEITLSVEAHSILERVCDPRAKSRFIDQLILDYDSRSNAGGVVW